MADPKIRSGKDPSKTSNTQKALEYCLKNPQWRLSLQMHKLLGID
jgi:7-carboxy-7-deazaguanine synthase